MLYYIAEAVLGYLLGSISFSVILTKNAYKKDVRDEGSGNAGATNVARVFGMRAGVLTLLLDILKMVIPMGIGLFLSGNIGVCIAGVAGLLGHCFPLFFGFRGGKGVSVAVAIAAFTDWRAVVIGFTVFVIVIAVTRIVSVASSLAAITLPITAVVFSLDIPLLVLLSVTCAVIIFMHRSNFVRLVHGEEKKFSPKKENKR